MPPRDHMRSISVDDHIIQSPRTQLDRWHVEPNVADLFDLAP